MASTQQPSPPLSTEVTWSSLPQGPLLPAPGLSASLDSVDMCCVFAFFQLLATVLVSTACRPVPSCHPLVSPGVSAACCAWHVSTGKPTVGPCDRQMPFRGSHRVPPRQCHPLPFPTGSSACSQACFFTAALASRVSPLPSPAWSSFSSPCLFFSSALNLPASIPHCGASAGHCSDSGEQIGSACHPHVA